MRYVEDVVDGLNGCGEGDEHELEENALLGLPGISVLEAKEDDTQCGVTQANYGPQTVPGKRRDGIK